MQRAAAKRFAKYKKQGIEMVACKLCGFEGKDLTGHIGKLHMPVAEYHKQFSCGSEAIRVSEYLKGQSERYQGEKNPGFNHQGRLSVYSKNNLNFDQIKKNAATEKNSVSCKTNGNHSSTLAYWLKQGFSENEAKKRQSERQITFSKELCIQKYGQEEGIRIWNERQHKWMESYPKSNYSQVSQDLFWAIYEAIGDDFGTVSFAELCPLTRHKETDGTNHESILNLNSKTVRPDFLIADRKAIIEFDGDYWHKRKNEQIEGNKSREQARNQILNEVGYSVLHIKEREYKHNTNQMVMDCIQFLKQCELRN